MTEQVTKGRSRIREILSEDGSPYLSAGRVGLFICLFFSMAFSSMGLHYSQNDKILNYCSLIALQFLGTAVLFYGSTKTSEAFKSKWIPPAAPNSNLTPIVNKVVNAVDAKLQQAAENKETPELEDVK
ncbi:MAG: hypothetical protein JHC33_05840 [Ignisphaera sp.]|nr:hypothetical protein [Ignisphaera sp.]